MYFKVRFSYFSNFSIKQTICLVISTNLFHSQLVSLVIANDCFDNIFRNFAFGMYVYALFWNVHKHK